MDIYLVVMIVMHTIDWLLYLPFTTNATNLISHQHCGYALIW